MYLLTYLHTLAYRHTDRYKNITSSPEVIIRPDDLLQVLRYYSTHGRGVSKRRGFVDLRRSDYIADGPSQFLLHGTPVINDCMYRNMYRFRHIIVVDFDEVFHDVVARFETGFRRRRSKR